MSSTRSSDGFRSEKEKSFLLKQVHTLSCLVSMMDRLPIIQQQSRANYRLSAAAELKSSHSPLLQSKMYNLQCSNYVQMCSAGFFRLWYGDPHLLILDLWHLSWALKGPTRLHRSQPSMLPAIAPYFSLFSFGNKNVLLVLCIVWLYAASCSSHI